MTIDASLNKRLTKVVRKHQKMRSNGVKFRVGRDGLITAKPRFVRPRFALKGILAVVVLFFVFKALLFAQMGSGNYALQIEQLRAGTPLEQAGAVLMQEEPITTTVGSYLSQYLFQR